MERIDGSTRTWTKRYAWIAGINALIAFGWIVPLFLDTRISRTIAGGSVGTWGMLGFLLWITVGVLGFAALAAMTYVLGNTVPGKLNDAVNWVHVGLMEVGTLGATLLLGIAGYIGGTALLAGASPGEVHQQIAFVVEPIPIVAILALLAAVGVVVGVLNHLAMLLADGARDRARTAPTRG